MIFKTNSEPKYYINVNCISYIQEPEGYGTPNVKKEFVIQIYDETLTIKYKNINHLNHDFEHLVEKLTYID